MYKTNRLLLARPHAFNAFKNGLLTEKRKKKTLTLVIKHLLLLIFLMITCEHTTNRQPFPSPVPSIHPNARTHTHTHSIHTCSPFPFLTCSPTQVSRLKKCLCLPLQSTDTLPLQKSNDHEVSYTLSGRVAGRQGRWR